MKLNLQSSGTNIKIFPINYFAQSNSLEFETHVSILRAGNSPHDPHTHPEEELIVILSGKLQIIRSTQTQKIVRSTPFGPGSLTYHESNQPHTLYSVGPEPAIYVCVKWKGKKIAREKEVQRSSDYVPNYIKEEKMLHSNFETALLIESSTDFLDRIHCHISHMKPRAGYKPHIDSYYVMIILLEGKIETLQKELDSNSIIFYHAGEPHGLKNIGSKIARYVVFEFQGSDHIPSVKLRIRRAMKLVLKRVMPKKILTRAFSVILRLS